MDRNDRETKQPLSDNASRHIASYRDHLSEPITYDLRWTQPTAPTWSDNKETLQILWQITAPLAENQYPLPLSDFLASRKNNSLFNRTFLQTLLLTFIRILTFARIPVIIVTFARIPVIMVLLNREI